MSQEEEIPQTQSGEGEAGGDEEGGGVNAYTPQGRTDRESMPPGADTAQDDPNKA